MVLPDRLDGESFTDYILRASKDLQPFKPGAYYLRDGDFIQCYLEDESCYTKSACDHVSIHLADSDDRIIGFNVHAVSKLIGESTTARIAALEAENAKLRDALRPFVKLGSDLDLNVSGEYVFFVDVADLRAAAEAMKGDTNATPQG